MKILLINDYATPTGGAEIVVLRLREELRSRGHDVHLLASSATPNGHTSLADSHCFGRMSVVRSVTQAWNPTAYLKLRKLLGNFQPDLVHVRLFLSQISPSILSLLRDTPTVFHAAWYKTICPLGTKLLPDGTKCRKAAGLTCVRQGCIPVAAYPLVALQNRFLRRGLDAFNVIIANSHATGRRLAESGIPVAGVVWNGVADLGPRKPLAGPPTVAYAGRLVPEKGCDLLIKAFSRVRRHIPDAKLLIAGEGQEMVNLKRLSVELKLSGSVSFLGLVSQNELHQRFADVWVQVVPSLWEEPFGLVAAEAMMRATPVIASRSGGLVEFVEHNRFGLLCEPGDETAFVDSMIRLLSSSEVNQTMGEQARGFALEHLTLKSFVDKWEELYAAMLSGDELPSHCSIEG